MTRGIRLTRCFVGVAVLLLAACSSQPDQSDAESETTQLQSGVYFPIYTLSGPGLPAAMIEGTLTLDADCLWIDAGEDHYLALWPEGWTASRSDGTVTVTDPAGNVLVTGRVISVGGGEEVDQDFMASLLDAPVPEACRGEPGWLVTDILD